MSDNLLDRFAKKPSVQNHAPDTGSGDEAEDLGCFGWLRGVRDRSIMLELRQKDGHVLAVAYSWIDRVEFEPEKGITVYLPGRRIRITGSRLNTEARTSVRLFDGIIRHRVPWIREAARTELLREQDSGVLVERIQWDD